MMPAQNEKGRLIILGGGVASLTAAFYASEPGHKKVFPGGIHVYEMSDCLGGKGASHRSTTEHVKDRIEEHGLHVWFGSYDNAFTLLNRCHELLENKVAKGGYKRWATSLRTIEDGFRSCSRVGLMDYDGSSWLPWVADFPEDATARPWQPRDDSSTFGTPMDLASRGLRMVESFLFSLTGAALGNADSYATFLDSSLLPIPVQLPRTTPISDALNHALRAASNEPGSLAFVSRALGLLTRALGEARNRFDEVLRQHDSVRRGWYLVDLVLAAVRGLVDDGVLITGDYSLIDDLDLRAWLVLHGASQESVDCSFLKAIVYDLGFAYDDGDPKKPSYSAATSVYGLLRLLLTYRGAIMWKMNAGMGEIVFAPIYEALLQRGVNFHFGCKVKSIAVEDNGKRKRAARILFENSNVRGLNERLPLIDIEDGVLAGKLPYWDVRLPKGEVQNDKIELGEHDMVVFGLPVGTIQGLVNPLPASWQNCASRVKAIPTAALQVWLEPSVDAYAHWASPDITVGAYTEPFDTWADMRILAGEKDKDKARHVGSVAYFANAAPSNLTLDQFNATVAEFMKGGLAGLWPNYQPKMVIDQYQRLNNDASSRYTLSLPGTLTARLSPLDKTIINVRPVGDWTRTSISAGCIEAAVTSGMIAALALRPDRALVIFGEDTGQLAEKI